MKIIKNLVHCSKKTQTTSFRPIAATVLLALAVTTSVHGQNWMTNGLVAHYPLHGDASDVSGHGMHGRIIGAPMMATNRFGEPGHGFVFAGGMDAIMLTNLNVNLTTNNQNTVCLWMRWDGGVNGATNPVAMPFGWGNTNENYCLLFQREGNGRFGFSGGWRMFMARTTARLSRITGRMWPPCSTTAT